jgi:hypothetical protein
MKLFMLFEIAFTAAAAPAGKARQAGIPPISTVVLPGPGASGDPWLVGSPVRAAKGMF